MQAKPAKKTRKRNKKAATPSDEIMAAEDLPQKENAIPVDTMPTKRRGKSAKKKPKAQP